MLKIKMRNRNIFITIFFVSYWSILWGSINSFIWDTGVVGTFNSIDLANNIFLSINSLRSLLAWLSSLIIILIFIFLLFSKKIIFEKIHFYSLLFFICHLIGLFLNENKSFNSHFSYLAILSIGAIIMFIIIDNFNLKRILILFFWINFVFLIFVFCITFFPQISEINSLNLYRLYDHGDLNLIGETNPRITGLSRTLAIINLSIFCLFLKFKNFYFKYLAMVFLIASTLLLFFMQSRGSLICYFTSLLILIIFLIENFKEKIKKNFDIFFITFFSILLIFYGF